MNLGNKLLELRKKENMSQEQLAEKMGVTRQTISKWELNETTPDIRQAQELAKIYRISLDELTDNEIKNVLVEKVSNTEKLAGIIIKILKVIGVVFIAYIVLMIIAVIGLGIYTVAIKDNPNVESSAATICSIDNQKYQIDFGTDSYFKCENCSDKMGKEIKELVDFNIIDDSMKNIENYFESNNGTCE